jgi:hypothetical protein
LSTPGHNGFGGGIYSTGGALSITGATLANNQASGGRGGDNRYLQRAGDGGSAHGGGLYATGGSLDISDSTVASNRGTGGRGGDGSRSTSTRSHNGGYGGSAQGGGLYLTGSALTISTSTIASNQGTGGSGGAYGGDGSGVGGGLYNGGTLTVSNCTLSGNSGGDDSGIGGGIENSGTLMVTGSTLSGNYVIGSGGVHNGGGIWSSGTLTVSNSTLSGNSAYQGGGIFNLGTVTVSNSTVSGNSAVYGGGINNYGGALVMRNTIHALNSDDPATGHIDANYNLLGGDPLLGPLQDNGGPTFTMALLPGSPAIDAGDNTDAPMWDQRGPGFPRIVNGTIDIGAYEVQAHAHNPPTGQPLPDPLPVQVLATLAPPLLGQPPDLPADFSPVPGLLDGQAGQSEPVAVPTATGQQAPATFTVDGGNGQPVDTLGPLDGIPVELPTLGQ